MATVGLSTFASLAQGQQPAETTIPPKVQLFIPFKEYTVEENQKILEMYKWLRVADVFAAVTVIVVIGSVLMAIARGLEQRVTHWQRGARAFQ